MKHLCTILATVFAAAFTASAKTFDWPIDSPAAKAAQFTAYHGETVRFNLRLGGAMTNLSPVAIYYQTNGMGKAEWFGPVPGTVFHPTNDCGAAAYRFFILCNDPDGKDYTANGSLRLLDSPGFEPSAVQLPVQSLDFTKIEVLNPPWGEGPGNYAAVSNAAMTAAQTATNLVAAATNGIPRVAESGANPGYAANADWAHQADNAYDADYATYAGFAYGLRGVAGERTSDAIFTQLDAATAALSGKASTNDVHLTPVYSQTPTYGDEWVCTPATYDGVAIAIERVVDGGYYYYVPNVDGYPIPETDPPQSILAWVPGEWPGDVNLVATRVRTDIIGYTLGSQTNKVIAATNGVLRTESDPTVPAWAKSAQKPKYTSSEVGAYPNASGEQLSSQVASIGAHLNAEDARFVSTNYNSETHLPEAYVEVKVTENGESSWLTVWREMTRWNWFLGIYTNDFAALSAALATKGEREYAFYDGVTGEPAPDGFFWISQPRVAVAAGMSYQRHVDTGGAVWVLESNGMVADVNGTTNGFFRVSDDEGNVQFEIVKGAARTVAAVPGTMAHESVMGVTHWFTTYAVTNAASAPVAMFCRDIGSPEWHAETDGDCPCNVAWTNPESGVYVCEWWAKGTEPRMFMKSEYGQGTESRIVQTAPVQMQHIVINGVKGTLGTATIDGKTVLTFTP